MPTNLYGTGPALTPAEADCCAWGFETAGADGAAKRTPRSFPNGRRSGKARDKCRAWFETGKGASCAGWAGAGGDASGASAPATTAAMTIAEPIAGLFIDSL